MVDHPNVFIEPYSEVWFPHLLKPLLYLTWDAVTGASDRDGERSCDRGRESSKSQERDYRDRRRSRSQERDRGRDRERDYDYDQGDTENMGGTEIVIVILIGIGIVIEDGTGASVNCSSSDNLQFPKGPFWGHILV